MREILRRKFDDYPIFYSPKDFNLVVSATVSPISAREDLSTVKITQIPTKLPPNFNGSPVVNLKGEVIGIVAYQIGKIKNLKFVVPIKKVVQNEFGGLFRIGCSFMFIRRGRYHPLGGCRWSCNDHEKR